MRNECGFDSGAVRRNSHVMRYVLLLAICACGRPPPATLADACYDLASTLCDRMQQCGTLTSTAGQCRTDGVAACCAGADCGAPVRECKNGVATCCADASCTQVAVDSARVAQVFDGCNAAIRNLTCGQLAAGLRPSACASSAADAGH